MTPATIPGQKIVIPQAAFYPCLFEWLETDTGKNERINLVFGEPGSNDEYRLLGWRQFVGTKKIDDVFVDGPKYLQDIRMLEEMYGFEDTYSYSTDMLTQEMFVVIILETILSATFSLVAIFIVILLISGSFTTAILVSFSVCLVDLFLMALIPLWGMTFNNILVVHLVASLGLSVLYSAHIAHAYILALAPASFSKKKRRIWKARVALSRVGPSVMHGSLATLLAVIIVGLSRQSYFFVVFFKLWIGIVAFGTVNAFILIPIVLSFVGPTPDYTDKDEVRKREFFLKREDMTRSQAEAMRFQYNYDEDDHHRDDSSVR